MRSSTCSTPTRRRPAATSRAAGSCGGGAARTSRRSGRHVPQHPRRLDHKGKLLGLSYFVSTRGVMHVNLKKYGELGYSERTCRRAGTSSTTSSRRAGQGREAAVPAALFNEWYGISWAFNFEVLNRGGTLADPETHKPMLTTDKNGPAYKTLAAWKKIWNDKLVPEEVLTYNESAYIDAYASGRYVFSPQQLYDLETFNARTGRRSPATPASCPTRARAGACSIRRMYLMTSRKRDDAVTERREAVRQLVRLQGPERRDLRRPAAGCRNRCCSPATGR